MKRVLNVGCNSKTIELPPQYAEFEHEPAFSYESNGCRSEIQEMSGLWVRAYPNYELTTAPAIGFITRKSDRQ